MNKRNTPSTTKLEEALANADSFRAAAREALSPNASGRVVDRQTLSTRLNSEASRDSGDDERQRGASPRGASLRGDWDLNAELRQELREDTSIRPAAVLVPVIAREKLTVLLTVRPIHMKTHAGQISFPGGKIEQEDDGPLDAALREAEEETGLDRRFVEPLGFLDSYATATGFLIMPVVGLVAPGFNLVLDPGEVASSFEVPLIFLMDEANHQRHSIEWQGKMRFFHAISHRERYIWGATAGIIKNLHERLSQL